MSSTLTLGNLNIGSIKSLSTFTWETKIGTAKADLFSKAESLTAIDILDVDVLCAGLFVDCTGLKSLKLPPIKDLSQVFTKDGIASSPSSLEELEYRDGTESIGDESTLSNSSLLSSLSLPNSLTSDYSKVVNSRAGSLTKLAIPLNSYFKSVNWNDCSVMNSLTCKATQLNQSFPNGYFSNTSCQILVLYSDGTHQITKLETECIHDCADLQTIYIHYSPSDIEFSTAAISKISSNFTLHLPKGISRIKSGIFSDVQYITLTDVDDDDTTSVPMASLTAIEGSTGAKLVFQHFPQKLKAIGIAGLSGASIQDKKIDQAFDHLGENAFDSCSELTTCKIDYANKDLPNNCFANSQISACDLTCNAIGEKAFYMSQIEQITVNKAKHEIKASAFENSELSSYNSGDFTTISKIGDLAFNGCQLDYGGKDLSLASLEQLGENAFQNSLTANSVTICSKALQDPSTFGGTPFNGCDISYIKSLDLTIEQLNALSSKLTPAQSFIPKSHRAEDVKTVFTALLNLFFGTTLYHEDCEIQILGYTFNKEGTGSNYDCLLTDPTGTQLTGIDTSKESFQTFKENPVIQTGILQVNEKAFSNSKPELTAITTLDFNYVSCVQQSALVGCTHLSATYLYERGLQLNANSFCNAGKDIAANLSIFIYDNLKESIRDQVAENRIKAETGTAIFLKKYDESLTDVISYKNPVFIATGNNSMYECPTDNINVQLIDGKLTLCSVEDGKSSEDTIKLESTDLSGIQLISPNVFYGKQYIREVDIPNALAKNGLTVDSLYSNYPIVFQLVDVKYYDKDLEKYKSYIGASMPDSSKGVQLVFSNGVLQYDTAGKNLIFVNDSIFIVSGTDPTKIIGVKQNIGPEYSKVEIPTFLKTIETGALSTTTEINSLSSGGITAINSYAFAGNASISSVTLTDSVKKIGSNTFYNTHIQKINIPGSLTAADGYGLNCQYGLRELTYDRGVKQVNPSAMIDCAADCSSIAFPSTLTSIGSYAFARTRHYGMPYIKSVNFSSTKLKAIGDYAFYTAILSAKDGLLKFPSTLTSIGAASFGYSDEAWEQAALSIEFAPDLLVAGNGIRDIGPSAFINNSVKSFDFSKNTKLSAIGDYAFAYPLFKYSLYIPSSIKHIGENALKGNKILNPDALDNNILSIDVKIEDLSTILGITEIDYSDYTAENRPGCTDKTVLLALKTTGNNFVIADNKKLNFCPSNISIDFVKKVVISSDTPTTSAYIPSYVTAVSANAFNGCTHLKTVQYSSKSIDIQASAFYGCKELGSISSIESQKLTLSAVEPYTFYSCNKLANVELALSTAYVKECAFAYCRSMTTYQPYYSPTEFKYYSLKSIEASAFAHNTSLTSFYIPNDISYIGKDTFLSCNSLKYIKLDMTVDEFNSLVGPEKTINENVKDMFGSITSKANCEIQFNDSIYTNDGTIKIDNNYVNCYIVSHSLSGISSLNYADFTAAGQNYLNLSNIVEVNQFAFRDVTSLQYINFHLDGKNCLSTIMDFAFSKCESLFAINGNMLSCNSIGMYAFSNCSKLTAMCVSIEHLKEKDAIKQGAFANTSMEQLTFQASSKIETTEQRKALEEEIKLKIGYSMSENPNPLELPEYCQILIADSTNTIVGRYDYLFHDLLHSDIDISQDQIVFTDKRKDSIKPLFIAKTRNDSYVPAIVNNNFHVNIIGRWK